MKGQLPRILVNKRIALMMKNTAAKKNTLSPEEKDQSVARRA